MRNPALLALDCGASHVTAVLTECHDTGRVRVLRSAVEPLAVTGEDESRWFTALGQALRVLRSRHGIAPQECTVGLPGHLVLTKLVRTPSVERKLRARVVQFEAAQNIPQDLAEVAWGHVEVHDDGSELELMLAAVKNELMERLCIEVESAGYRVARAEPASLALARLRRHDAEPNLLVDVGARSIQLVFSGGAGFFTRTLGWGGNALTRTLADGLGLDFAAAEQFKAGLNQPGLTAGTGQQQEKYRQAAEAFAERLALEITRSRLSYSRQPQAVAPVQIEITGAGARMAGLQKILANRLDLPVVPLALDVERAESDRTAANEDQLAVALGLAGASAAPVGAVMNLLPQSRVEQLRWRRRGRRWLAVAGLLALALLPPLAYYQHRTETLQAQIRSLEDVVRPLRQLELRQADNRLRLEELTVQLAAAERLVAHRDAWVRLLADLQIRLAGIENVWLDRMQPTEAEPGERRLVLAGRLLDAANPLAKASGESYAKAKRLMESLGESPFVQEVTGERFDNQQPGILRFEVSLVMKPEVPL